MTGPERQVQAGPAWVVQDGPQLRDCLQLAAQAGSYGSGICSALRWALGEGPPPLSPSETAASPGGAEAEFFLAGEVERGESPLSAVVPPETAQAVGRTLAWLLGWEQQPPIDLPRRPVPTADELYAEAVAAEPWRYRLPEEQSAARLAATREAARLTRLAARADAAQA